MRGNVLTLATRYARAVIGLARDDGTIDETGRQLATLAEAVLPDRTAWAFWRSLKVPADEKRDTLQDILERMDASALVRNTANLLMERGRLELLPDLATAYRRQARELSQEVEATVASASALGDEMLDRIRQGLARMTGKTVRLTAEVDPELLSGIRVRIGNRVIDGSARGRLAALARSFA